VKRGTRTQGARRAVMSAVAFVGITTMLEANLASEASDPQALVQRVLSHISQSSVAWRATRDLRAGTRSGKHEGWMEVETALTPAGSFTWTVLVEGGSERTRNKVFRELLQAEAQSIRSGSREAALSPDNYEFLPMDRPGSNHLQLRVRPRRADPRLVDGVLTVAADGSPLKLEGQLAKSPSFWVKSVTVVNRYGRFGGVTLPVAVESLAELRMVGQSTFTMRYRYSEVNGRSVSHGIASLPMFGPSPELHALHSARLRN